jgi:hypothetical protein
VVLHFLVPVVRKLLTVSAMKLINAMEQTVRAHLKRLREASVLGDETCWCPLCRADMMALALSSLPPRYATRRPNAADVDPAQAATVHGQILKAARHVASFPKHPKGAAVPAGEPVWVVNFPLEESFRAVDGMIRTHDGVCDCWNCRCDMVAFALNRYPSRYGVEHEGKTHLLDDERERIRVELSSFLDLALRVVTTVPRHEFQTAAV